MKISMHTVYVPLVTKAFRRIASYMSCILDHTATYCLVASPLVSSPDPHSKEERGSGYETYILSWAYLKQRDIVRIIFLLQVRSKAKERNIPIGAQLSSVVCSQKK